MDSRQSNFLAGAATAVITAVPAAIGLLWLIRHSLQIAERATVAADEWRTAAANAAVAAQIAKLQTNNDDDDEDDDDYSGG